jgi:8-oxo-dGTP pyrophosphatase MutT (NUDIX family)
MKNSSDFTITEIEKLITISNLLGINIPDNISASVDLYLNSILTQLKKIPYVAFPVSFHTVDIAIFKQTDSGLQVLLGRKPGNITFQFIGGFVDPGETSYYAAQREITEETNIVIENTLDFIGSFFIDDGRFGDSPHKITTSFFGYLIVGDEDKDMKGMDDIEEVKWFDVSILEFDYKTIIGSLHHKLFENFIDWLKEIKLYEGR